MPVFNNSDNSVLQVFFVAFIDFLKFQNIIEWIFKSFRIALRIIFSIVVEKSIKI
jgi:hypothetical protein